jgi:hypothetical protein
MPFDSLRRHDCSVGLRVIASCGALWLGALGCAGVNTRVCTPAPQSGTGGDVAEARICTDTNAPGKPAQLEVQGGVITVELEPADYELERDIIWKWIGDAARAVTTYYGHFPVAHCHLRIAATGGRGARWGQASAHPKVPTILIRLGRETRAEDLTEDWTLTHEMVHLACPNMASKHLWIEEGLATYVESISRFKIGLRKEESIWLEWIQGMPQGQPKEGDRGLDFTPTWGRVYWGGALFALVADVEIRRVAGNGVGLRKALQGIVEAGGNMKTWWKITQAFTIGDRATQTHVLSAQYERMRAAPEPVKLDELWVQLGVRLENGRVILDDNAPQAALRKAILRD